MHDIRLKLAVVALLGFWFVPTSLYAFAHIWSIKEIFSNADGTVQFIELYDPSDFENQTNGTILTANSNGSIKTYTLNSNLSTFQTADRHMLIATPGFATLPGNPDGVTPNFTLPAAQFFDPNAPTLTFSYSASGDTLTFPGSMLPKDGFNSLTDSGTGFPGTPQDLSTGPNSPTPFPATTSGQIDLRPPSNTGDYNGNNVVDAGDYVVWRDTLTQSASPAGSGADGDGDGMIDDGDYEFWRARFGNPVPSSASGLSATAVPEPVSALLVMLGLLAFCPRIIGRW